LANAEVKLKC